MKFKTLWYDNGVLRVVEINAIPIKILGMDEFFVFKKDEVWSVTDKMTGSRINFIEDSHSKHDAIMGAKNRMKKNKCFTVKSLNKARKKYLKNFPEVRRILNSLKNERNLC